MFRALVPVALALSGFQSHATQILSGSVYTDINAECVVIEESNEKAEIDFARRECKSFGGYRLEISGGDIRYSPRLFWADQEVDMDQPGAFHDTGSDKVEWVFRKSVEDDGSGDLEWVGFIYRLKISNPEGDSQTSRLYAVRLDQGRTCSLGVVPGASNELARKMVLESKSGCR